METIFKGISVEVKTKNDNYPTTGEQSRAFRKLWKILKLPKASFKSESFSMGDALNVELLEEASEEVKKIIQELEYFFQKGSFNGYEDYYENKKDNNNPFCFKFVCISFLRA